MDTRISSCFLALALATALAGCSSGKTSAPPAPPAKPVVMAAPCYDAATTVATLADKRINESSGLAVSWRTDGLFWTHNDSGDGPELFAIDRAGKTRCTLKLQGASALDWEDLCSFHLDQKSWLLVADTGDNYRRRGILTLYLIEEPPVDLAAKTPLAISLKPAQTIRLRYADGCHDVESVAFDVATRTIYLLSKRNFNKSLYALKLPAQNDPATVHTLKFVARVPDLLMPNGMDISADGRLAVVCTYTHALLYVRQIDQTWAKAWMGKPTMVLLPNRRQGESICFGRDSRTLYLTSEKLPTPLWELKPRKASK